MLPPLLRSQPVHQILEPASTRSNIIRTGLQSDCPIQKMLNVLEVWGPARAIKFFPKPNRDFNSFKELLYKVIFSHQQNHEHLSAIPNMCTKTEELLLLFLTLQRPKNRNRNQELR